MFSIEKTLHKQVEVSDVETLLEGEDTRLYILGYLREKVLDDEEIREMLEDYSDLKMTLSANVTYHGLPSGNVRVNAITQIRIRSGEETVFTAKIPSTPIGKEYTSNHVKRVYYYHGKLESIAHELVLAAVSYLSGDYE
jgi:hypothetical protein